MRPSSWMVRPPPRCTSWPNDPGSAMSRPEPLAAGSLERIVRGRAHSEERLFANVEPLAHAECLPHLMRAADL